MKINKHFNKYKLHYSLTMVIVFVFAYFAYSYYSKVEMQADVTQRDSVYYADDHYKIRNSKAKYTIIEYMDMDCPHCKVLDDNLSKEKDLLSNFNYIVRLKPTIDKLGRSLEMSKISECVYTFTPNDKNYFAFLDKYKMANQLGLINMQEVKSLALQSIDKKNITMSDLESCITSEKIKTKVDNKNLDAAILGVASVPTLLIIDSEEDIKSMIVGERSRFTISLLKEYLTK